MEADISARKAYAKGLGLLMSLIDKTQIQIADHVGVTQPTISRALGGQVSSTTMRAIADGLGWDPMDLIQVGRGVLANKSDPFDYTGIVYTLSGLIPILAGKGSTPLELINLPQRDELLQSIDELQIDIFRFVQLNPNRNIGWVLTELDYLKQKIRRLRYYPD